MSTIRAGNTTTTGLSYTSDVTGQLNLEAQNGIVKINGTGALVAPSGTTAERPGTPTVGMTRYNTTDNLLEVYTGTEWKAIGEQARSYSVEYLVVAGGGGGARYSGGGAGGLVQSTAILTVGSASTVTIGAGGSTGVNDGSNNGVKGSNSIFDVTTIGGGAGRQHGQGYLSSIMDGGSGAGGDSNPATQGGVGTSGQGNNGGAGANNGSSIYVGGGGGGVQVVVVNLEA
jgi:hypothetical protein